MLAWDAFMIDLTATPNGTARKVKVKTNAVEILRKELLGETDERILGQS